MDRTKLIELLSSRKDRSAWDKGVTLYALELVESLDDETMEQAIRTIITRYSIPAITSFDRLMMNGASSWSEYSWGGCSLIYNADIAERLCTPTELKRTHDGTRRPNKSEDWLDVQARALFQASRRIRVMILDND